MTEEATIPATAASEQSTADLIQQHFDEHIEDISLRLGEQTVVLNAAGLPEVATWLRDERDYAMCIDVTASDCSEQEPRFRVVYHLLSPARRERIRLKVPVSEDTAVVPSVVEIWPGANFFEREVFDMFGIVFEGHPNLKRILMPEDWDGHPLRKDYPLGYEPVAFTHNREQIDRRKPYAKS